LLFHCSTVVCVAVAFKIAFLTVCAALWRNKECYVMLCYSSLKPTNEMRFLCHIKVSIKHYIILSVRNLLYDVTNYVLPEK